MHFPSVLYCMLPGGQGKEGETGREGGMKGKKVTEASSSERDTQILLYKQSSSADCLMIVSMQPQPTF